MGDWSTYSLIDFIPFAEPVYHRLFVRVNEFLWPGQIAAILAAAGALWALLRGRGWLVGWLLGLGWCVVGWVFHHQFYAELNWAGTQAGALFLVEGLALVINGHIGGFDREEPSTFSLVDTITLVFGMVIIFAYPLLSPLLDHRAWAGVEIVGIAPNPTALLTLVTMILADRVIWHLMVIPLLWCLVAGATAWAIGTVAGLVTAGLGMAMFALAFWKTVWAIADGKYE